ncbi:MAG TPA: iron-containing alcohol dehydrogenase [Tepidisphaeraceae bacterium]|jgi:alcohol dehydrogenase class IV|nr:iron-containing alcohol dehydrogenase [Tepidisphaeraceae bacterium]
MVRFEFFSVPRIIFGRGQIGRVGEIAASLGKCALVVFNGGEELSGRVAHLLTQAGVRSIAFRQRGEPQVGDVDLATEAARGAACDMVIGLGGGSAIDAAKAVAGLLANGGEALDYMEVVGKGQKIRCPAVPWAAIPTTAGTGAEVTRNAVIGAPERRFKASIRGEQLLARVALIDPELGVAVPPDVTARSGMDALCQCIESYTSTGAQPMTDALAMQGVTLAARSLRRAFADGADLAAREDMAMAALLSGITLTNAGLGAVHGFAAPLGANFPAPHGAVCAALLPHVIAANVAAVTAKSANHPVLARYATVGRALVGRSDLEDAAAIDAAVRATTELARDLRIARLGQFGVKESDVPGMVELAKKASSMRYNPVELTDGVLADVLRNAI